MNTDKVRAALRGTHPDDRRYVRNYALWVHVRRQVHKAFYFQAHWVRPSRSAHWV